MTYLLLPPPLCVEFFHTFHRAQNKLFHEDTLGVGGLKFWGSRFNEPASRARRTMASSERWLLDPRMGPNQRLQQQLSLLLRLSSMSVQGRISPDP